MNTKTKKIISRTANILSIIIGVLVLIVAINAISAAGKGYSSFFGVTAYAVKSDSMDGLREDSFKKNDLILAKVLSEQEKKELKENQIITFFGMVNGNRELITHRIIKVSNLDNRVVYTTQGDKVDVDDTYTNNTESVLDVDVVAVYSSNLGGIGGFVNFIQSPTGFLVLVVVPSVLVVCYCAYIVIKNYGKLKGEKRSEDIEKLREQLMQEMQQQNSQKENSDTVKEK